MKVSMHRGKKKKDALDIAVVAVFQILKKLHLHTEGQVLPCADCVEISAQTQDEFLVFKDLIKSRWPLDGRLGHAEEEACPRSGTLINCAPSPENPLLPIGPK